MISLRFLCLELGVLQFVAVDASTSHLQLPIAILFLHSQPGSL